MHDYYISTDEGSIEVQAENVSDALRAFGIPPRDANSFIVYLEDFGGYGRIEEDGVCIALVAADDQETP